MIQLFLVFALAVGSITAAPQLIDFNNGGVGVNFGGYSARAGLGGLLTGNAADGGLSASAGTPFGQRAAAGLGGSVNGNAAGGLYAGAQANDAIGASAGLGGSTGPQTSGFLGAEAHSINGGSSVTKTLVQDSPQPAAVIVPTTVQKVTTVQKIKTPIKKYVAQTNIESRFGGAEQQVNVVTPTTYKTVQTVSYPVVTKEVRYNPSQYLNIPIGILKSLQESLQPIAYSKQVSFFG